MTETYYYSATTGGFYAESNREQFEHSPSGWPDDALEVSNEKYEYLFAGQAQGKCIVPDENGAPTLSDPPAPTKEQLIATSEAEKSQRLAVAQTTITVWQTKLLMGRKLTDSESENLNAWIDYIDAVTATDTSTAPDINWPTPPGEQAS